jgi:hypothetical protein
MLKGDKEYCEDLVRNYVCAEHGAPLTAAWHSGENSLVIRCGHGHFPEEVSPWESVKERDSHVFREPFIDPDEGSNRPGKKQPAARTVSSAVAMGGIKAVDLGSGALIPRDRLEALVRWTRSAGLVPELGHTCLMHGEPYVTIDGYLYHAADKKIDYHLRSRPLTTDERSTYQIPDGAHAWVSELIMGDGRQSFVGQGIVLADELTAKSKRDPSKLASPVVAAHPWQLAQKRSEWQVLRRAFPLGVSE